MGRVCTLKIWAPEENPVSVGLGLGLSLGLGLYQNHPLYQNKKRTNLQASQGFRESPQLPASPPGGTQEPHC